MYQWRPTAAILLRTWAEKSKHLPESAIKGAIDAWLVALETMEQEENAIAEEEAKHDDKRYDNDNEDIPF